MKVSSPVKMAFPGPPRRGLSRYLLLAIILVTVMYYYRNSAQSAALSYHTSDYLPSINLPKPDTAQGSQKPVDSVPKGSDANPGSLPTEKPAEAPIVEKPIDKPAPEAPAGAGHPIDRLIDDAQKTFDELMKKQSNDLNTAAAEYRKRRGRHPPPGFDTWYAFAMENGAVMVEDFFDQIYHDLGPYWGLAPVTIRKEAAEYEMTINIRNHNASAASGWFWTQIWLNMTQSIQHLLPDMDLPLNAMDEPRILAPWEEISALMVKERESRNMIDPKEVINEFQKLPPPEDIDPGTRSRDKSWETEGSYWNLAIRGCRPDSLARRSARQADFSVTPSISLAHTSEHMEQGYVKNFTLSTDFCHQPDLQGLHGMMIEPLSVSSTHVFSPMFGGSKLPTNNEILLPAPMYWHGEERFTGGNDHGAPWSEKKDKVIWRGVATGGRNKETNWRGFQRHRFVAMTNGTQVTGAESWKLVPENFALPQSQYHLAAQEESKLGEWIGGWSDTGFVDMMCHVPEPNGTCNYTSPYFEVISGMKMADQFARKYLPDIDGNSFSGRYRGFLMSSSLPIKATIFKEWHDSRLVAWKHFVPMDNRFMDFWGIMEYFLGYDGKRKVPGHDKQAEKIALDGQDWANKVLRKEDMQIYTLRLLLEYARLNDDRRDKLGWVQDLL
ncbi:glycosyltransferase family 90 protein [Bisporella sp. PMI_857]|nr:glycosyltransferase family 90 protein [Bisporella sp. PMI_857]